MVKSISAIITRPEDNIESIPEELLKAKCWTHSDEALLVTLVTNNIDVWISKHKGNHRAKTSSKFTKVMHTMEGNQKKTTKEWSKEGITYYNARINSINEKFNQDWSFDVKLMKSLCPENATNGNKRTTQDDEPDVVVTVFESELDKL